MKKALFLTLGLGAVLGLASCKENETKSTMTYQVNTFNLVTSVDGSGTAAVAPSTYKFDFDLMNNTATMGTAASFTAGNSTISFDTGSISYTGGFYYGEDGVLRELIKMESFKQGSIYNIDLQLFTPANITPEVDGAPKVSMPSLGRYVVMSYQSGDNTLVRTFWNDVTFCGTTITSYNWQGVDKQFSNKDMKYRVVMNPTDKKATVVLYNAKFAEEMPSTIAAIEIKDLTVTFTQGGYTITGNNVVPNVYEGGQATPNPRYVFEKFTLTTGGDLTSTTLDYEVAGGFKGHFEGSYIAKPAQTQQ